MKTNPHHSLQYLDEAVRKLGVMVGTGTRQSILSLCPSLSKMGIDAVFIQYR